MCTALGADRANLAPSEVDLSCTSWGVKLENPFLLSSSVVASTYEKNRPGLPAGLGGGVLQDHLQLHPPGGLSPLRRAGGGSLLLRL